jgi:hypothetical protein
MVSVLPVGPLTPVMVGVAILTPPKKPGFSAGAKMSPPKLPIGDCRNFQLSAALAWVPQTNIEATEIADNSKVVLIFLNFDEIMGVSYYWNVST